MLAAGANGQQNHVPQLTNDMITLAESLDMTPEAKLLREGLVNRIQGILNSEWPKELKVEAFGSFSSGLGTNSCDLDLIMTPALDDREQDHYRRPYTDMLTLKRLFQRHGMKEVEAITNARVPIVKFTDPRTEIQVDINFGHLPALYNTRMIQAYVSIDSRVKTFVFVLKAFVKARGINSAPQGSLSSYCYTLMAISYFQTLLVPVLPCLQDPHLVPHKVLNPGGGISLSGPSSPSSSSSRDTMVNVAFTDPARIRPIIPTNNMSLGELFLGFLEYYGTKFEYSRKCVAVASGGVVSRNAVSNLWNRHAFCVQDPFITDKNVAHARTRMMGFIRHEFQAAVLALKDGRGLEAILTVRPPYSEV